MTTPGSDESTGVTGPLALGLVAVTSGLVLVLEILAGRLMAPYVGVSLDTFTGIIGTILAGIALGAAVGGHLADRHEPMTLIARALFIGGGLTWLSIPIVSLIGPGLGSGPVAIVILAACGFFLPAAVLSGIGPMVAKLELGSLEETGAVVGRLSAASTFGALVGTFGTGFVLIALLPVRTIIIMVGALLVVAGLFVFARTSGTRPTGGEVAGVIVAILLGVSVQSPCDQTTDYYCVTVIADEDRDMANPRAGGRSLIIDQLRHAHVDLDDPEYLDIRYIRLFADVAEALPDGPLRVLHVGGGGFSMPRYLNSVRPGSTHVVLELDDALVGIAERELGLDRSAGIDIRTGDARLHLADLPTDGFDLIVGDAFGGSSVPWHLTTVEVIEELDRMLVDDGVYVMNVIDGGESRYARAQLATLKERLPELGVIAPEGGIPTFAVNLVLVASKAPLPSIIVDPADGRLIAGTDVTSFIGNDAQLLTDNFAPADQLLP